MTGNDRRAERASNDEPDGTAQATTGLTTLPLAHLSVGLTRTSSATAGGGELCCGVNVEVIKSYSSERPAVGWSAWLGASMISLFSIMRHLHSMSFGAVPSSIRVVGVFEASWMFTPRTYRGVDPGTTARWKIPAGMKTVSPFESLNTRAGVS
jgi:hypothetical protein